MGAHEPHPPPERPIMTNPTPHGQVPEALQLAEQYDHGDPAAHGNAQKVLNHNNLHLECGPVNAAILAARAPADSAEPVSTWCDGCSPENCGGCHIPNNAAAPATQQYPAGWYVTGCSRLLDEDDAKAEARHIGGTARAIPLYTAPQPSPTAQAAPALTQGATIAAGAEREAFEAWFSVKLLPMGHEHPFMQRNSRGEYNRGDTAARWEAWQARASYGQALRLLTQKEKDSLGRRAEGMDGDEWDQWVQEKFAQVNGLKVQGGSYEWYWG